MRCHCSSVADGKLFQTVSPWNAKFCCIEVCALGNWTHPTDDTNQTAGDHKRLPRTHTLQFAQIRQSEADGKIRDVEYGEADVNWMEMASQTDND